MYIILRLVCETFSRIAVSIRFLWGHKYGVYAAASFSANVTSWCSRNGTKMFTSVILYINIIFIAQWLSGGNSEILHGSDVFACCQKLCKEENSFQQTRVNFFYRENMTSFLNYVTATLRALFAWRGSNSNLFLEVLEFLSIICESDVLYSCTAEGSVWKVNELCLYPQIQKRTSVHANCRDTIRIRIICKKLHWKPITRVIDVSLLGYSCSEV